MAEAKCAPCDVSAAAKVLIEVYCAGNCNESDEACKNSCYDLLQKMVEKDWSLKDLARKLGAQEEDIEYFRSQGVDVETGLKTLLERDEGT